MSCDTSGLEVLSKLFYLVGKASSNFYANCYISCTDAKSMRLARVSPQICHLLLNTGGLRQSLIWPNNILKMTCNLWRNIGDFYHAAAEILILKLPANIEIFCGPVKCYTKLPNKRC